MTVAEADALIIREPFDLVLLAEMYADLGDEREEAVRWLIAEGKWPAYYKGFARDKDWGWWMTRGKPSDRLEFGWMPSESWLPAWHPSPDKAIRWAISEVMKNRRYLEESGRLALQ